MKILHDDLFSQIISIENLFCSWNEFKKGKRKKPDVQLFERNLEENLFTLHDDLLSKTYRHSHYTSFFINDPKRRNIHKACVRDRIVHHAIYRILYPIFDKTFIYDSYSCRNGKGTHKAVDRLQTFIRRGVQLNAPTIIKCDIKKFFASIDHEILFNLIKRKIKDEDALWLVKEIINSFATEQNERERESTKVQPRGFPEVEPLLDCLETKGIPLGNLTSQLFANIYLNELDQFVKHRLRVRNYVRYCDDMVAIVGDAHVRPLRNAINNFLNQNFKLQLHPEKTVIHKPNQGMDFLGYVVFPHHKILRTKTKKRMFKKIEQKRIALDQSEISLKSFRQTIMSYMGICSHAKALKIGKELRRIYQGEFRKHNTRNAKQ